MKKEEEEFNASEISTSVMTIQANIIVAKHDCKHFILTFLLFND